MAPQAPASPASNGASKAPSAPGGLAPEEAEAAHLKYDVKKAFGAIARIHKQSDELTPAQEARLKSFTARYNEKTKSSKAHTQEYRAVHADPRVVTGFKPRTKELTYPIVTVRAQGARLWDLDGNEYVDALNGFGSGFFGNQHPRINAALHKKLDEGIEIGPQTELAGKSARLVCELTGLDRAAFCNTGSEAVMGALRIARTATGRPLVVAFSGSYHGIFDEVIVRDTKTMRSVPAAPGILPESVHNILVLEYGSPRSLEIIRERADEIAAVLVEPVQSRRPDFQPKEFIKELRKFTKEADIALIFDEVITGFRSHPKGAQHFYDIEADICTYGKVVGGGMPIGVIAGRNPWMDALDGGTWQFGDDSTPTAGVTYFAGTFVRHPLTMAAVHEALLIMKEEGPALQERVTAMTTRFAREMNDFFKQVGVPIEIRHFASLWKTFFTDNLPYGELVFVHLRERGVHIWDGFPCFFTTAHTDEDADFMIAAYKSAVEELQAGDFLPRRQPEPLDPNKPPAPGARLGRDPQGNPAWFVPDPNRPGNYVQVSPA
jgi:glutamate-1-semialdehyde aminotransferase